MSSSAIAPVVHTQDSTIESSAVLHCKTVVYDQGSPIESAAALWCKTVGRCTLVAVDRKTNWSIGGHEEQLKGQSVLIFGSYSAELVEIITKLAAATIHIVYSTTDKARFPAALVYNTPFDYVRSRWIPPASAFHLHTLCVILNKRESGTIDDDSEAIIRAIKANVQAGPLFIDRLAAAALEEPHVLLARGRVETKNMMSVIDKWYADSFLGNLYGHKVRVCHANPFISDTAREVLKRDTTVAMAVVYRVEGTTMRFTLVSRDNTVCNAVEIAVKGCALNAGFGLSLIEGATFLNDMIPK